MFLADEKLRLISIFDDLFYDRSDLDILSPAMRNHAVSKLISLGFEQVSGTVLVNNVSNERCLMPKFHALGSSPFDITLYTPRNDHDFYILTPTQTACQIIDNYSYQLAVKKIEALIKRQPINIHKIFDYLEQKKNTTHKVFASAMSDLLDVQRKAVKSDPLKGRRALGHLF
tara:strand:- start:275 stop:790 length:516 start_codon:yes stop_codon:yes gene_type:complete